MQPRDVAGVGSQNWCTAPLIRDAAEMKWLVGRSLKQKTTRRRIANTKEKGGQSGLSRQRHSRATLVQQKGKPRARVLGRATGKARHSAGSSVHDKAEDDCPVNFDLVGRERGETTVPHMTRRVVYSRAGILCRQAIPRAGGDERTQERKTIN